MPVQFKENITPNLIISVWKVTENIEELRNKLELNVTEEKELDLIRHPRGKKQWLAARSLIKETLNIQDQVIYNELGVPFLKGSDVNISLSHSGNRVAFACNEIHETGIDIQQYNDKIFNVAPKFMNDFELNWVGNQKNKKHLLHLLWNFKESLFKYYTTNMPFKSIEIQPFEFREEGWVKAVRKLGDETKIFQMRYHTFDKYYLGYLVDLL